jgi:succinate dehydrogenase (ubiquinone) cytochrome b560 subunit
MAALSCITNRVAGVALSVGAACLGVIELVGGCGASLELMQFIGSQGSLIAAGANVTVAFPVAYHFFGGIRHLAWDCAPPYVTNVDVEKSSLALFGALVAVSAA